MKKMMKLMVMVVILAALTGLTGCGSTDVAEVAPAEGQAAAVDEYAFALAARPVVGAVGEVEVTAFVPAVPTTQEALWFSLKKIDGGEATAILGGRAVATKPDGTSSVVFVDSNGPAKTLMCVAIKPDGTASVILKEPAIGGIYEITVTTVLEGSNPPAALPDSAGNPGALWKSTILVPIAGPQAATAQ